MTSVRYRGIDDDTVRSVRETLRDAHGNALHVWISDGGGNPCRSCLRLTPAGTRLILFAHRPFTTHGPYAETGPVFVHAEAYEAYALQSAFPGDVRARMPSNGRRSRNARRRCAMSGTMRPDIRVADDVLLTPIRMEHAPAYAALVDEERVRLVRWLAWAEASRAVDDVRSFIAAVEQRRADDLGENYVVLVDGVLAGSLDVHDVNRQHSVGALGYWLGAGFGGRGVMTRSVRALTERAFADHRLHRLEILAATENVASRRVAERAGFALEAVLRQRLCAPAGFDDCALYVRFAP